VAELQARGWLLVEDGNHGEDRPRPSEFGDGETVFIRAADMSGGRVLFGQAQRISEVARARIRKGVGQPGDVLFSHKGTVGKLALVPLDAPLFVCSPQTTFWRALDDHRIDRRFLYYFMSSRAFVDQWQARKGETDMADYVSLTAQRDLLVAIPPIERQRAVGRILGALDDRIELNREMNRMLEAMAQALFKSWFVDFDPVIAKAAGRQPFGMDAETVALLPNRFVDSEMGQIPEGWRVSTIGEETRVVGGSTPSTDEPRFWEGGRFNWTTPKDLSNLATPILLDSDRHITEAGLKQISSVLLPRGTVLLSSRAPIGYTAIAWAPTAINQGFIAMVCDRTLGTQYVFHWVRESLEEILARAGGTTFAEISKASFRPIPVLVPPPGLVEKFEVVVGGLFERVAGNVQENNTLAAIRDYILPRLLSGEIRVKDAEDAAAGALA